MVMVTSRSSFIWNSKVMETLLARCRLGSLLAVIEMNSAAAEEPEEVAHED